MGIFSKGNAMAKRLHEHPVDKINRDLKTAKGVVAGKLATTAETLPSRVIGPASAHRATKPPSVDVFDKSFHIPGVERKIPEGRRDPPVPPPLPAEQNVAGASCSVAVDLIDPSPYQPRRQFDKAELGKLAANIQAHGLGTPVRLRPGKTAGRYELVYGERRWRAVKQLGWREIPAYVTAMSDDEARRHCLIENIHREGLNPLEKAAAYQSLLDTGVTQREAAEQLDVSQADVGNTLRLLKLPVPWRQQLITGEIKATHGRYLASYVEFPALLEEAAKVFARERKKGYLQGQEITENTLSHLLGSIARQHVLTRPIEGRHVKVGNQYVENHLAGRRFDDTTRGVLGIVKIDGGEYATNVEHWDTLHAAAKAAAEDTSKAKKSAKAGKGKSKSVARAVGKKPTPAQVKEQEAKRREELDAQLARRVKEWTAEWAGWQCHETIDSLAASGSIESKLRLLCLWHALAARGLVDGGGWRSSAPKGVCPDEYVRPAKHVATLAKLKPPELELESVRWIARCFWRPTDGRQAVDAGARVAFARHVFEIDFAAAWKARQGGPLTQRFLELHTTEQLAALGREYGLKDSDVGHLAKSVLVTRLMDHAKFAATLPKSIARAIDAWCKER